MSKKNKMAASLPTKQEKRDKQLSNKKKYLKRRKERDRRDNHVQDMFSEATHEQKKRSIKASGEAGLVTEELERRGAVAFQKVWRGYEIRMYVEALYKPTNNIDYGHSGWYNKALHDYWHDVNRRQREDSTRSVEPAIKSFDGLKV